MTPRGQEMGGENAGVSRTVKPLGITNREDTQDPLTSPKPNY